MIVRKQDSALDGVVADKEYTPMEDQVVRDELANLGQKIRNWARKNSVAPLEDLSWEKLVESIPFSSAKIPLLLLQALLTKLNECEAHTWRSQTLRGLCKLAGNANPSLLHKRTEEMSENFATTFVLRLSGGLLHHPKTDEAAASRVKELQQLYEGAAQLALSLWTQRSLIVCRSLGDVPNAPVFDVRNPVVRAHRLHKLDEDDHKLDGKKIVLFVQPAFLAFGSENAEHYDQYKVWASAVVVVDER
ncbi:hypothetical protein BDW69DRAFT_195934 [Aspergillus filifer]